jgi:hypothetical protein
MKNSYIAYTVIETSMLLFTSIPSSSAASLLNCVQTQRTVLSRPVRKFIGLTQSRLAGYFLQTELERNHWV